MRLATFRLLKKLMDQTFSPSDGEALNALRAANKLLAAENLTWDRVLSKTVTVIAEVEAAPEDAMGRVYDVERDTLAGLVEAAEEAAEDQSTSTQDFVADLARQFRERGSLSPKQTAALRRIVGR